MRALLLLLLAGACGLGTPVRAEDAPAEAAVAVAVDASKRTCVVGELVRLRLTLEVDRAFLAARAAPLFRRPTDLPVHVEAPWLRALPGARLVGEPARPRVREALAPLRVAVNDDVVAFEHLRNTHRDGRTYAVLALERRIVPERPGELVLGPTSVRYVVADRFEEDFVGGRVALDPRDVFVRSDALTIRVQPWPAEGRPEDFTGAVGRLRIEAQTDRATVDLGSSLHLTLRIEGDGDLEGFERPRLDHLPGFHVLGALEERAPDRRTIVYEIAPLDAAVTAVPSVAWPFLDPGPPATWGLARTTPIPLDVRGTAATPAAEPGEAGGAPPPPDGRDGPPRVVLAAILALALGLLALLGRRLRRRRGTTPGQAEERRRRVLVAAETLRARADAPVPERAEALAALLAAHLGCPPSAVVAPGLAGRLEASGLGGALAARASATLERLVAAAYGSGEDVPPLEASWLDEMQAAFLGSLR